MFISKFEKALKTMKTQYDKTYTMAYDSAEQSSVYMIITENMFHDSSKRKSVYINSSNSAKLAG